MVSVIFEGIAPNLNLWILNICSKFSTTLNSKENYICSPSMTAKIMYFYVLQFKVTVKNLWKQTTVELWHCAEEQYKVTT